MNLKRNPSASEEFVREADYENRDASVKRGRKPVLQVVREESSRIRIFREEACLRMC